MADLLLAIAHHLLMLGIAALLIVEFVAVREGMPAAWSVRLGRIDIFFGLFAGGILVVGFLRVFVGARPESYYLGNLYFWIKIAAFLVVAVLSIQPTLRLAAWARAARSAPAFTPEAADVVRVRRFLLAEVAIFILVPTFAAIMARYDT
ncbi:MAG: DUF2214 family protein [Bauldia sp.]